MKHLTKRPNDQYVISSSVPPREAQAVSEAITAGMDRLQANKAEMIRQAILCFKPGMDAIQRNALALDIIRRGLLPDAVGPICDILKALTGCQADVTSVSVIKFTDESDEYKKFKEKKL